MSSGLPYADALKLARKAAPLLDITVASPAPAKERVTIRRVAIFQEALTVTLSAKLVVIYAAVLLIMSCLMARARFFVRDQVRQLRICRRLLLSSPF